MIYLCVLLMTVLGAFASISLKQSTITKKRGKQYVLLGGFLYVLSAIINVFVLKFLPYAVVLPLTSLTYIWSTVLAVYFFGEKITIRKILGLLSIMIGVIMLVI